MKPTTNIVAIARDLQQLADRAAELARTFESAVAPLAKPEPCQSEMDPLLDQHDLATFLRVGDRTLRRMRSDGRIPDPIMFGTKPRWRRSDIDAWLARECGR